MKIIPVINCPDWECLDKKMRVAEEKLRGAEWLHLDVADNKFTFSRNWGDPNAWHRRNRSFRTEVHLMFEEPQEHAEEWLKAGAGRIIVHLESMSNPGIGIRNLETLCNAYGAELGLAINPETPVAKLKPFLHKFSYFLIFAQAYIGPPGQKFLPSVLHKIRNLRELAPHATIEVDGGMDPQTVRDVKQAGADTAVSGSAIFGSPDPAKAYAELSAI